MKEFKYEVLESSVNLESIRISKDQIKANLNVVSGKDLEQWVFISPSLNVSGYGKTEDDAKQSFIHNMETFMIDFVDLDQDSKNRYLKELGWEQKKYFSRRYSKAFMDKDGILQNLEMPQTRSLQAVY